MSRAPQIPFRKSQPASKSITKSENEAVALFKQGLTLHQQGQLVQAERLYQLVLAIHPRHFDALHLLGVLAAQSKDPLLAVNLISRAIEVNPKNAASYFNRGNALRELGKLDDALENYEMAIAIKPDYTEAYFYSGDILKNSGRLSESITSYEKAIQIQPDLAEAYYNRGNALLICKRLEEAVASYERAIDIKPNYAEAYYNRGNAFLGLDRLQEAVVSYEQAIAMVPHYAEIYSNRGVALEKLKRLGDALVSYERAIEIAPNYAEAFYNHGNALLGLRRVKDAVISYERAIELAPDYAEAYCNHGKAVQDLGYGEEAIASYNRAIDIKPDYAEAYYNRGVALEELKRMEEAIDSYSRTIEITPDYSKAHFNKSLALLVSGEFSPGWDFYEWRWETRGREKLKRNFEQALWLGKEDLTGKVILLHAEQGLGDTIQFCRYTRLVKQRGAYVFLEVPASLLGLLGKLEGVDALIAKGSALPPFDFHCPLLSLPLAFKTDFTNIPCPTPYLAASATKCGEWKKRLGEKTKMRVGLVWSGSSTHTNDHNRSMTLQQLLPYLPDGYEYVSLQKEIRPVDKERLESSGILQYSEELEDFTDTAALCALMDLVISVDTSVVHLAGAIGKTTWVLLPNAPDWRWLLDRDDSPWYESLKLYRQGINREWSPVLERVMADLQMLEADF